MGLSEYMQKEAGDDYGEGHAEAWRWREKLKWQRITLNKVVNAQGVTVGDVYDRCVKLAKEHKRCLFARPSDHDNDGWVRPCVTFFGILPDDVVMPKDYEHVYKYYPSRWNEMYDWDKVMCGYVEAKREGECEPDACSETSALLFATAVC